MKQFLIGCMLVILVSSSFSDNEPTHKGLIKYAYDIAKEDGHKDPKYLLGIIKVESKAGEAPNFRVVKQDKSRFFGIGQLTIGAAKDVMKNYPELWNIFDTKTDEELQARLIVDDRFNIRISSKYLLMMGVNKNPSIGVSAYNLGSGRVKMIDPYVHPYTMKVFKEGIKAIKEMTL